MLFLFSCSAYRKRKLLYKSTLLGELVNRDPLFAARLGCGIFWQEEQKRQEEQEKRILAHDQNNHQADSELIDQDDYSNESSNTASIVSKEELTDQSEESVEVESASFWE